MMRGFFLNQHELDPSKFYRFRDFSCFCKPAGDDIVWENPCKNLAGHTKIEVRLSLASKISFVK